MLQPREYQNFAVASIYEYFGKFSGDPVLAMPTGTGKSVVIAMFLKGVFESFKGQKVVVATHVKELIQQNYDKLMDLWPHAPAGINSAGLKQRDWHHPIIFAGVKSIARDVKSLGFVTLLLIDEAHLVSPDEETSYRQIIKALREINPNLKVIGFTATPWRLGHGRITEDGIFTDVCFDMTTMDAFRWLVEEGYMAPLVPKQTKYKLDVTGVHMRGGEFAANELQLKVDKNEVTQAALMEAVQIGHDRHHWLCFASGVEHANHVADMLNDMGISAIAIHSKMGDKERDAAILDFKAGKYRCAVNNNILTTGFDFPAIDFIIVLRPTASTVLWVQLLGRGTRPLYAPGFDVTTKEGRKAAIAASQKQNCLVADFARNTARLGPIDDPVIPKKKGKGGGSAPVKICPSCDCYNHTSARQCFYCGAEFPLIVKIGDSASELDLMRGAADMPVVEVVDVQWVEYVLHQRVGRPDAIRVNYYCGLQRYNDFVCLEHDGFAARKAREWWRTRSHGTPPDTTAEALTRINDLPAPTQLRVWVNKKPYPQVMAVCFDGTAFGTKQASAARPVTRVRDDSSDSPLVQQAEPRRTASKSYDDMDDDIPF